MFRLADYECAKCGTVIEKLVWLEEGESWIGVRQYRCIRCEEFTNHESRIGLPAPYMGEKVLNPEMSGGAYDTMGHRELEPLPDLPGQAEANAKIRKAMAQLPDDASHKERKRVFAEAAKDAPSSADYATLFEKPEYKEAERKNKEIVKQNKAKRKRAKALKRGENVNMRRDKCAGDPDITG